MRAEDRDVDIEPPTRFRLPLPAPAGRAATAPGLSDRPAPEANRGGSLHRVRRQTGRPKAQGVFRLPAPRGRQDTGFAAPPSIRRHSRRGCAVRIRRRATYAETFTSSLAIRFWQVYQKTLLSTRARNVNLAATLHITTAVQLCSDVNQSTIPSLKDFGLAQYFRPHR